MVNFAELVAAGKRNESEWKTKKRLCWGGTVALGHGWKKQWPFTPWGVVELFVEMKKSGWKETLWLALSRFNRKQALKRLEPLINTLFAVEGVSFIRLEPHKVSVTKDEKICWDDIKGDINVALAPYT